MKIKILLLMSLLILFIPMISNPVNLILTMIADLYYNISGHLQTDSVIRTLALTSLICTLGVILSLIILGVIMNGLQKLQISVLQKIFGLRAALFISNYGTIPGTILHETAHALFGILTGAKITEISFLDTQGDSLGHIGYIPRGAIFFKALQHTLIACAPVFAGLICEYFLLTALIDGSYSIWMNILFGYLAISVMNHMSMSPIDIKHYFQGMWATAPLLFLVFFVVGFFTI